MLFTELPDSQLVHGGSHILDGLLQVLGVTLHQWLGDAAAAVLWGGKEKCLLEFRRKYDSSGGGSIRQTEVLGERQSEKYEGGAR